VSEDIVTHGDASQQHRPLLWRLARNWLQLLGVIIVLSSWFAFVFLLTLDLFGPGKNPYVGILTYLVAPMFFLLGLALWTLGWITYRRQRHRFEAGGALAMPAFTIDVSRARDRRILLGFVLGEALFLLITAIGSYQTYTVTQSVTFCGQACHTPMQPEFVTYQHSPHARVACTECHIGPGAENFVKAKFNGIHQIFATAANNFPRPIRLSHKIDINQRTCEQCHWPQRWIKDRDRTYTHFLADETNTQFSVRLSLHIGGGDPAYGPAGGIHWHMNLANRIEYIATDPLQQVIPWVRFTDPSGKVTEFRTADFKADPAQHKIHKMDCVDCHNRPAHQFRSANEAVDLALATGRVDSAIPWVKSNLVAALVAPYATRDDAMNQIDRALRTAYPGHAKLEQLVSETQHVYRNNFFPEMKADWRAYPNNIGHKDFPGCFRCHDGRHVAADGSTVLKASDCNSCHTILAQGTGAQLQNLSATGHTFFHIDAEYSDFACHTCHTGGVQNK
jgi:ssDNA-binding Zn-finger/Zn-ribbon topoisomerase 1